MIKGTCQNIYKHSTPFLSVFLILAVLLLALTGCTPTQGENTKLKIVALPYVSFGIFYIAQEEGYFAEQDLEVEFVKFPNVTQAIPLLAQGELDVAAGPVSPGLINAIANSAYLKIVAGKEYVGPEGITEKLMVNRQLFESGDLDELMELKGKKIAIPAVGVVQHYALLLMLNQAGLSFKDVELVKLAPQDAIAALGNQAVAAAVLGQTQATQAVSMGYASSLLPSEKVLPGFQQGFVFFGPTMLKDKPEIGKKFLIAYLKGCAGHLEGKTDRNVEILSKYTGLDRDILLKSYWHPVLPDGRIVTDDILSFQKWLFEIDLIEKQLSSDEIVDDNILKSALKAME